MKFFCATTQKIQNEHLNLLCIMLFPLKFLIKPFYENFYATTQKIHIFIKISCLYFLHNDNRRTPIIYKPFQFAKHCENSL